MKKISVDYSMKETIFSDCQLRTCEFDITETQYERLKKGDRSVALLVENAILNIARLQGYQYADVISINY